ncbi:PQQ-binding-like beta-propeller repeat protein [Streptomyces sp. NPDC047515]|uniref:outer membrane protein assembly factor BamB family protein n=1 Tax=Streptomyces sp. NPDC047515 TaxID=3155380 RepID=UPI0033DFAEEA
MNLLALDHADGDTLRSKPSGLPQTNSQVLMYEGSFRLSDGTLFCFPGTDANGSTSGLLAAFDPVTGRSLWSVRTAARGNRGYDRSGATVCCLGTVPHAVDVRTGAARWATDSGLGGLQFLGAVHGLFLAAGPKGLYGFHADSGKQVWHHPVSGGAGSWSAFSVDGRLFTGCSGKLICFSVPKA